MTSRDVPATADTRMRARGYDRRDPCHLRRTVAEDDDVRPLGYRLVARKHTAASGCRQGRSSSAVRVGEEVGCPPEDGEPGRRWPPAARIAAPAQVRQSPLHGGGALEGRGGVHHDRWEVGRERRLEAHV